MNNETKNVYGLIVLTAILAVAIVIAFYYPDIATISEDTARYQDENRQIVNKKQNLKQPEQSQSPNDVNTSSDEEVKTTSLGNASKNTYKDKVHSFELTFPAGWVKLEHPKEWESNKYNIYFSSPENEKAYEKIKSGEVWGEGYMYDLIVRVDVLPENTTLLAYINDDPNIVKETIKAITINGVSGYQASAAGMIGTLQFTFEKDGKIYILDYGNASIFSKLRTQDIGILNSFEVTK